MIRYHCLGGCKPASAERRHDEDARTKRGRFFKEHDLAKIDAIDRGEIPHWYPDRDMIAGWETRYKRRLDLQGVLTVADLYTKRNLWALAALIGARRRVTLLQWLDIPVSVCALTCSRMLTEEKRAITKGTYYLPPVSRAITITNGANYSIRSVLRVQSALALIRPRGAVAHQSASSSDHPRHSIDYVFVDPPYVDKVQYGELNFVWESWLGFDGAWLKDEIVVNPFRDKTLDDWDADMRKVLAKVYAALKPNRWRSLCYHDTDPGTWTRLQNMLVDTGFEIHTITVLGPKQKSSNQLTSEKVVKSDLVVNCRRPRPGETGGNGNGELKLVSQRVREILIETLSSAGGQTRDHLWDTVLKRLLSRGQMAVHRFDDILSDVAFHSESGRWFLKDEYESLSESDITSEEKASDALVRFARLRMVGVPASLAAGVVLRAPQLADTEIDDKAVETYIRDSLIKDKKEAAKFELGGRLKGVEFYDCLFFYLTRWLKGRPAGQTPRRNLADFLGDYLVRFKDGDKWLYRPPDEAEAQSLREASKTGLGRRIRQFVAFVHGEGEYPQERVPAAKTLVAWLKHCAAFGLADEGVALFAKGGLIGQLDQLPKEDRFDAEDYYAQCLRRAGKSKAREETEDEEPADKDEGDQ